MPKVNAARAIGLLITALAIHLILNHASIAQVLMLDAPLFTNTKKLNIDSGQYMTLPTKIDAEDYQPENLGVTMLSNNRHDFAKKLRLI